jgi:hypothetical protein
MYFFFVNQITLFRLKLPASELWVENENVKIQISNLQVYESHGKLFSMQFSQSPIPTKRERRVYQLGNTDVV